MSRIVALLIAFTALACVSAIEARAGEPIRPESIGFKRAVYHAATGVLEPVTNGGSERLGNVVWRSTQTGGWYYRLDGCGRPGEVDEVVVDWGDLLLPSHVDGIEVGYVTESEIYPRSVQIEFQFLNNCDGFGEYEWSPVRGFVLELPAGSYFPYVIAGWIVTVDLAGSGMEFALGEQDLDGDTRLDFGYSFRVVDYQNSDRAGPLLSEPNDPLSGPGAEDAFDLYVRDPNAPDRCAPGVPLVYDSTPAFGTGYLQVHLALYGTQECTPADCGSTACDCADLDADGRVDLADLSRLLTAYGADPGEPRYDAGADVVCPFGVHLDDLSALLSVYGLECE